MTAALEGAEWSAARPGRTLPRERPGTHCTGGWVGPRVGLEGGKSRPHRDSIPNRNMDYCSWIFRTVWLGSRQSVNKDCNAIKYSHSLNQAATYGSSGLHIGISLLRTCCIRKNTLFRCAAVLLHSMFHMFQKLFVPQLCVYRCVWRGYFVLLFAYPTHLILCIWSPK